MFPGKLSFECLRTQKESILRFADFSKTKLSGLIASVCQLFTLFPAGTTIEHGGAEQKFNSDILCKRKAH
jgi:hypothetical protein